ncbi:MAG: DUF503 domain-containing protein [Gammaproteobacteria bacterium]
MSSAHILFMQVQLHIPHAHSLKEKRKPVAGLRQRLQSKFNVSVAEIDYLDDWQQSLVGICMISNDRRYLESQSQAIEQLIMDVRDIELNQIDREWL